MRIFSTLPNDWSGILEEELQKPYIKKIDTMLSHEYQIATIYPTQSNIFEALEQTSWEKVSVVILGQDPYHQAGQAHGLAFSVPINQPIPPSLQNIFKEIKADVGTSQHTHGNLTYLATQGVLLLNSILTVQANTPQSHRNIPWEKFTDTIIKTIETRKKNIVFMLWGKEAQKKQSLIDSNYHLILTTSHPSPLSAHRGFLGCRHFSQCNSYLKAHMKTPIDW